jgi:hypothetical protein
MATNRTRDKRAKRKEQQWRNGAAYELTQEEGFRAFVSKLIWEKRHAMKQAARKQAEVDAKAAAAKISA